MNITRGTAIVWIHPKYHAVVEPLITSHYYKKSIQEKFYDQGTDEMTNYFVIKEAIDYYKKIGGRKFLTSHADNLLEPLRHKLCQGGVSDP